MGYDVTTPGKMQVFACPTKYSNNNNDTADTKCAGGFALCKNADNINLGACNKLGQANSAFFISSAMGQRRFGSSTGPSCGSPNGSEYTVWGGCGKGSSTFTAACMGFTQAIDCLPGTGTFQCKGGAIGDTVNNDGSSGVLCCHP
jgi:hypothetical protein